MLDIENNIVTIDAMGTQVDIANKIIEKNADYILAVKGNQEELLENIEDEFKFLKNRRRFRAWENRKEDVLKIALNLLKNETSKKLSMKSKRLQSAWSNDNLAKIINLKV